MELLEGIETRRSIRGFKSTPIPQQTVRRLLQAAGKSPSYTNTQPWEVAVVTGKKRDELSRILYDLGKSDAPTNPDIPAPTNWLPEMEKRSFEHGAGRARAFGLRRDDAEGRKVTRLANFEFYGAPCVLFLFMDSTLGPWSIFDMGLFAQTLALAAHSFGLGTCLQAMVARYPDIVREFLGIPKTKRLVLGISIGYPDLDAKANAYHSDRAGVDTFVTWYK